MTQWGRPDGPAPCIAFAVERMPESDAIGETPFLALSRLFSGVLSSP